MNVSEADIDRAAGAFADEFAPIVADLKKLLKSLQTVEAQVRRTRNAAAKELRDGIMTFVVKTPRANKPVTAIVSKVARPINTEFAEFAKIADRTVMTEEDAMQYITQYIDDNMLISTETPERIVLDRRLKILLGLTSHFEPNISFWTLRQNIKNVFVLENK